MLRFTLYVFYLVLGFCIYVETDGVRPFSFFLLFLYVGIDGVLLVVLLCFVGVPVCGDGRGTPFSFRWN